MKKLLIFLLLTSVQLYSSQHEDNLRVLTRINDDILANMLLSQLKSNLDFAEYHAQESI